MLKKGYIKQHYPRCLHADFYRRFINFIIRDCHGFFIYLGMITSTILKKPSEYSVPKSGPSPLLMPNYALEKLDMGECSSQL